MRPVEALVFLSLAAGLHVGAWSLSPRTPGASADGGPGEARVTLAAAAPQQAALARAWRAAPAPAQSTTQPRPAVAEAAELPRVAALKTVRSLAPVPALPPVLPVARPLLPAAPALAQTAVSTAPEPAQPEPPGTAPSGAQLLPRPQRTAPAPPRPPEPAATPDAEMRATADTAPPPPPPEPKPRPKPETARKSKPASAAAPAVAASGGGRSDKARAGRGGADRTQSVNAATRNRLQAEWGARIQRRVHRRLIYPRGAKGTGTARVALTVDRNGRLVGVKLIRSAGNPAFDKAALSAVRRARRFPAAPEALTRPAYTFTLSLAFRR